MRNPWKIVGALAALVAAAACALALDAAVVLADGSPAATTRPAAAAVVPSTQPVLVGGPTLDLASRRPVAPEPRPMLAPAPGGASAGDPAATVTLGAGVTAGQTPAAPPSADSGYRPVPTSQPAAAPQR